VTLLGNSFSGGGSILTGLAAVWATRGSTPLQPPGIIQRYSKIDILSPYVITPIYWDPEKHIVLTQASNTAKTVSNASESAQTHLRLPQMNLRLPGDCQKRFRVCL
jgi:hypothetical protein